MQVDDLILAVLKRGREADSHVIARRLIARLSPELVDELISYALVERVQMCQRQVRATRTFAPEQAEPGPSKWAQVYREPAPFIGKFLDECTAEDLRAIVASYEAHLAGMRAARDRFAELLAQLEATGAETVAGLDALQVAA